jgi:isopenicillin-N N-acyltransferase-like protein
MTEIPKLRVSGTHFECGEQIGKKFKSQILEYLELCRKEPPENLSWQECLEHSVSFLEPTEKYFPDMVEEIKGAAQGAGVDFVELFTSSIEELYAEDFHLKACTDIIILPPASEHTLVVHNNDLSATVGGIITAVEWNFADGSRMFSVGLAGIFVSVGANDSKIVLSGNELTPTDVRTGIPRALIARAILSAKTFDEAVAIATHPERASSYNNIITVPGRSVSIEGSATEYDLITPTKGFLTHSNHYCSTKMIPFEGKENNVSSINRLNAANQIISGSNELVNLKMAESFLTDHGSSDSGTNDTLCRHGEVNATVFGFAVDLEEGIVELSSGNPCQNPFRMVWEF